MSPFEISRNFEASTAHIQASDDALLAEVEPGRGPLISFALDYGYLIYVPGDGFSKEKALEIQEAGFSKALLGLMEMAQKQDCRYLHLDTDGPVYDHLPTFDW